MTSPQATARNLLVFSVDEDRARQRGLRLFLGEGLFGNLYTAFSYSFFIPLLVMLGGSNSHVAAFYFMSHLVGMLTPYPGALLDQRLGYRWRKWLIVAGTGGFQIAFLMAVFVPVVLPKGAGVWGTIAVAVLSFAPSWLSLPAFNVFVGDLVPAEWRGRYFAFRNNIAVIAQIAGAAVAGIIIQTRGGIAGFQLSYSLACLFGAAQLILFALIPYQQPPAVAREGKSQAHVPLRTLLRQNPAFAVLCLQVIVNTFSAYLANPFFTPYLMERLGATTGTLGILNYLPTLPVLLAYPFFGYMADRWGNQRVMRLTSAFLPINALAYLVIRTPWQILPFAILVAVMSSGYLLARYNLVLAYAPENARARLTALYQMSLAGSIAIGAIIGGPSIDRFGYKPVFLLSAFGQALAALVVYFLVPASAQGPVAEPSGTAKP